MKLRKFIKKILKLKSYYLYFNYSKFNIWQDDKPNNLVTVASNGTHSKSTTTNKTAASGFICERKSYLTTSTNSMYLKEFNLQSDSIARTFKIMALKLINVIKFCPHSFQVSSQTYLFNIQKINF